MLLKRIRNLAVAGLASALVAFGADGACAKLASSLSIEQTEVVSTTEQAAGSFLPPNMDPAKPEADAFRKLPAFCRVVLLAKPARDSEIPIEVWLPEAKWNSKFRGQGNGGFAGAFDYDGMAGSVALGYATAGTDTGHKGGATDADWALHHPEKVIDFGYRAVHLMSADAKQIIKAYYGRAAERSYFDSCSDGGREALMEAQRFPDDYDGILAGAPANYWTHLITGGLAMEQKILKSEASYIPLGKVPAINAEVLRACDGLDGVRDGIITYQQRCHFDPQVLLCKGAETNSCLTAAQVKTVEAIYGGSKDAQGKLIFPPIEPGGETGDGGWKYWVTGDSFGTAEGLKYPVGFFRNMVYENPGWNFKTANVDDALKAADEKLAGTLNSTNPDLSAFEKRGGKLVLYHGWLDAAISPLNTIDYFHSVSGRMGPEVAGKFVRLYMVPGMQHCADGPGPYIFGQLGMSWRRDRAHNIFVALEDWVEHGTVPGPIIGAKPNDDRDPSKGIKLTRPLCPYPQVAVYRGSGDPNQAASFTCGSPGSASNGPR